MTSPTWHILPFRIRLKWIRFKSWLRAYAFKMES